jgi:hypothetical protein
MTLGCSRLDAGFDLGADLVARHFQVVGRLRPDPEFGAAAKITRASRSAVSGIARFVLTISLTRICGTPIALASGYCDSFNGFKKSSRRTSPG